MRTKLLLLAAVVTLAACPGPNGTKQPSQTSTTTVNPQASPQNATAMNPVMPPQRDVPAKRTAGAASPSIDVQLTEYEIQMPDTLQAGHESFAIANAGKENHSLVVEGNGVHQALSNPLTRGDRTTLDLDLKPGTYTVWCPMPGHADKGMKRTVTVK